jgi:hypothetical protein
MNLPVPDLKSTIKAAARRAFFALVAAACSGVAVTGMASAMRVFA